MFYLVAKIEDLALEGNLSDSFEGFLWRGKGGGGIYRNLWQRPGS